MKVSIDYTLIIQIVNFLVLIFVMNLLMYRPIRNMLAKRKEKIDNLEENIEIAMKGSKTKEDEFSAGIKNARSAGQKEKESLMEVAASEEKVIIDRIMQKAQAELNEVRQKIQKDAEEVRNSLLKDVDTFANEIGKKILGRV